jgi:predicted transcriptional regulator
MVHEYRDRVYIRKDVILKLSEYGELNQTKLMSYCGLNNVKHRGIIDDMVDKGLIERFEEPWGNKRFQKREEQFFRRYWSHTKYCSQGVREKTKLDEYDHHECYR